MKKTDSAQPAKIDILHAVETGDITTLKMIGMVKPELINSAHPVASASSLLPAHNVTPLVHAIQTGQVEAFNYLSGHVNRNRACMIRAGFSGFEILKEGTALDAAFNAMKYGNQPYFYEQLIATGTRASIGPHKDAIQADVAAARAKRHPAAKSSPKAS